MLTCVHGLAAPFGPTEALLGLLDKSHCRLEHLHLSNLPDSHLLSTSGRIAPLHKLTCNATAESGSSAMQAGAHGTAPPPLLRDLCINTSGMNKAANAQHSEEQLSATAKHFERFHQHEKVSIQ